MYLHSKIITIGDISLHQDSPIIDFFLCWSYLVMNEQNTTSFPVWRLDIIRNWDIITKQ